MVVKVTKVTAKDYRVYYWTLANNKHKQREKLFFCPQGKEILGQSPLQELEASPRSRLYLPVFFFFILRSSGSIGQVGGLVRRGVVAVYRWRSGWCLLSCRMEMPKCRIDLLFGSRQMLGCSMVSWGKGWTARWSCRAVAVTGSGHLVSPQWGRLSPGGSVYEATCLFTRLGQGFWHPSFYRKHKLGSLCFDWGNWVVLLFTAFQLPGGMRKYHEAERMKNELISTFLFLHWGNTEKLHLSSLIKTKAS